MPRTLTAVLTLLLLGTAGWAQNAPKGQKADPAAPVEQLRKMQQEHDQALQDLMKLQEKVASFPERMLRFAEKYPKEPAAGDALAWVFSHSQDEGQKQKAVAMLFKDHLDSPAIGPICLNLAPDQDTEKVLRTILEKNKHAPVQGYARFALANLLKARAEQAADPAQGAKLTKEAEQLYDQVATRHADLKHESGTLGDAAKSELFELRQLAVGRPAPEITGEDSDGKKFKLSDYRGKVVVLDFWAEW